jgi:hypothetical protein
MTYARIARKSRVHFLVLASLAFCNTGVAPRTVGAATPADQKPVRLVAELWSYSLNKKTMMATQYVVRSAGTLVASEVPTVDDYGPLKLERKRADVQAFDRLAARIHAAGAPTDDDDLTVAMKKIEKAKSWGKSPSDQLLASPDGTRAVLFPDFEAPLVVDLGTLHTSRLMRHVDPIPVPFAWSPDSTLLAFAPSEGGTLTLYNIEKDAVQATITTKGLWVQAIGWSPDMQRLALLNLVNRRLHKTPLGLLIAFSGHPDFRNDLVLEVRDVSGAEQRSVKLKSNLTEQSSYDYWLANVSFGSRAAGRLAVSYAASILGATAARFILA